MSNETSTELVVQPAPHITTSMSKNRLMQYTFFAILAVTIVSAATWSSVITPSGWNLGVTVAVGALIAVGIAVLVDLLIGKVASDSEVNTWSAAVFGLIVINCFSLGFPGMAIGMVNDLPVEAPFAFYYIALISLVGVVLFKKVMSLAGRKLVNPAAAAKFTFFTHYSSDLLTPWHGESLMAPSLAGPIGNPSDLLPIGGNGLASFGSYLQGCYAAPDMMTNLPSIESLMIVLKYHGWVGGASSIAVIVAGIALFVLARKYIKWKITVSYIVAIAVMSLIFSFAFGDGDLITRLLFTVFMGSSIFLAFFMATDPATTPYNGLGQIIFGVGLAVITILIQTFMGFFGGSLLALLIMNLAVPLIDRISIHKPFGR